jgi:hypothetical protein
MKSLAIKPATTGSKKGGVIAAFSKVVAAFARLAAASFRNVFDDRIMRTTTHFLDHQRSGNMLELTLDEETGGYKLRFHGMPIADEDFLRDLRRWIRQIGRGWQKRNDKSNCNGEQAVTANFFFSANKR